MMLANAKREDRLLSLLDTLPEEVRIEHILPHLPPQVLIWLNRANYIKYHRIKHYATGLAMQ